MFLGFRCVVDVGSRGWEGLSGFCAIYATVGKGNFFLLSV